jgi:hypothetical protein
METLDNLLLKREHFPIVMRKTTGLRGNEWYFDRIEIPPHHPSMEENGINYSAVPDLVYEVVEATVKDLQEIADKRSDIQRVLQRVAIDETGRIVFELQYVDQHDGGITVDDVPVVGRVWVGKKGINPYGAHGDQGIQIYPEHAAPSFMVPKSVIFSPELMEEYHMTEGHEFFESRTINCPNGWYRHNLAPLNAIFYKNLVIGLDNAVVREKYS